MNTSKPIVFSRPKSEKYFIDYADKLGLLVIIVLYMAGMINGIAFQNARGWFGTLPFILLIIFLYNPVFRRFAFRISIDPERDEYTFTMFRKKGSLSVKGQDIKKIYVNFFITFFFENHKVLYTGVDDNQLLRILKSKKNISFGRFWNLTAKKRDED
jgi:hypothetical protein